MPKPRKQMTLVEALIGLAILGVLFSMAAGQRQQKQRAHHPSARPAPRVSTEGRGNTIQAPESRKQERPALHTGAMARMLRALAVMVVVTLLALYLKRHSRVQIYRPPQHRHPPDANE